MEFKDYIRILRQRGWIVIMIALFTAVASFAYREMQPVVYESSLRLLVSPSRTDFGQAEAAKTLLRGYTQWMNSSKRAEDVINVLQLDMAPNELLGDVGIASDDSSFIINIQVENSNPDTANDIARIWGDLLIQRQNGINAQLRKEDRIVIEIVDDPQAGIQGASSRVIAMAGGVLGAIIGLLVIFLLEWIDSGVMRRAEDVERFLDVPVIGSIPK